MCQSELDALLLLLLLLLLLWSLSKARFCKREPQMRTEFTRLATIHHVTDALTDRITIAKSSLGNRNQKKDQSIFIDKFNDVRSWIISHVSYQWRAPGLRFGPYAIPSFYK